MSLAAAEAVLGSLMLDADAWAPVAAIVTAADFPRPDHRLIFAAIATLATDGKPRDPICVAEQLANNLENAGGLAYLSQLVRETPTAANAATYARYLHDHSARSNGHAAGAPADPENPPLSIYATEPAATRPKIEVHDGELPRLVREAEQALLSRGGIYQRAQQLVHIVELDKFTESKEGIKRDAGSLMIMRVERDRMRLELAKAANWVQYDGRKRKWRPTDPPGTTVGSLLCNVGEWKLPPLIGLVGAPTLRADGSLLSAPGYDADSGLYGAFDVGAFPPISPTPTREDALAALALLRDLYSECAFEREQQEANAAVAIAATITATLRHALPIAPMFAISAHKHSSGKTTIARVIYQIVTGQQKPPVTSLSENEAELRKKILAVLIAGDPLVLIDNVTEPIDSAALCAVITSPVYSDRLLGVSERVSAPTAVTWIATGNNLNVVGDLTSRTLLCTLDPEMELPEQRSFKRDISAHVAEHRGELLAAALTIPLAYLAAGKPVLTAPPSRFPEWDQFVRRPLLWLDCADPLATQADLRDEDPERGHLISVLHALHAAFQEETFTGADIMRKAGPEAHGQSLYPELQQALADTDVAGDKIGTISPKRLGRYLKHYAGRIENALRIQKAGKDRVTHRHRFRVTPLGYGVSGVSGVSNNPSRIIAGGISAETATANADNADNAVEVHEGGSDDVPF
jgi:hypothetical protein